MARDLSQHGCGDGVFSFTNHPGYFMTFSLEELMLRVQSPYPPEIA